jgi:hypothetical protein
VGHLQLSGCTPEIAQLSLPDVYHWDIMEFDENPGPIVSQAYNKLRESDDGRLERGDYNLYRHL